MGRVWTVGLAWGFLAWVPFFITMPLLLEVTLGLPVLLAGYLLIAVESVVGVIPDGLGFCLSLPVGMALSWTIHKIILLSRGGRTRNLERGVG